MEDVRSTYVFDCELGYGQSGITYLVTHKETKQQFTCKSISRRKLINHNDIEDVCCEVQIMYHLTGHRDIVELKAVYEDRHSVNLIMELCVRGGLFDRIIAKGHCNVPYPYPTLEYGTRHYYNTYTCKRI
ncbi:hypothetical protein Gotri_010672 [Gossypium trilobum]|uniref:Protein kinase domain-containing protein n=1 Tax=Gossypium trilobum TaxID=34281 RepID=A0A7J9ERN0_9ROSI|nr:hypothetical protein [Gossypium trilobum]